MQHVQLILVVIVYLVPGYLSLTPSQLAMFQARATTEHNTNKIGSVSVSSSGSYHVITSNGIPDHMTGTFPGTGNPNSIKEQSHTFNIPQTPVPATPSCLPWGPIGIGVNGIPLFNPYAATGYNAVEGDNKEIFDMCDGHPTQTGTYHYHRLPSCIYNGTQNELIGVAYDGYPIYGPLDENGNNLTLANLDACHGRTYNGDYRYHATYDFPYILGCFKGETPSLNSMGPCAFANETVKVEVKGLPGGRATRIGIEFVCMLVPILAILWT